MNALGSAAVFLTAVLLTGSLCTASDQQKEAAEILARAHAQQSIRAQGKPFHLKLRLHAERLVTAPIDGTYDELWVSPDRWRREILFPDFRQLEIGDKDSRWLSRNLDFRPRAAYLSQAAIDAFLEPGLLNNEKIVLIGHERRKNGTTLRCVELKGPGDLKRQLCFDSSNLLTTERLEQLGALPLRFEYKTDTIASRMFFPKTVEVYEGTGQLMTITLAEIGVPSETRLDWFQHSNAARQMAPCERPSFERPVKSQEPDYPLIARQGRKQGTVTLYALISGDGHVENAQVLDSLDQNFDQASLEAVRHWVYAPVLRGPVPLPTEIEIQISYVLGGG